MATFTPPLSISPVPHPPEQESHKYIDYFDIMVIGKTGTGKSTTADKLLIANPDQHKYTGEQYEDPIIDEESGHIQYSDMFMWHISEKPDEIEAVSRRLKDLVFYRSLSEPQPHEEINKNRMSDKSKVTEHCELLSSDSNKVRVLDIPGFYGSEASSFAKTNSVVDRTIATTKSDLGTMRKILHIKIAQKFKFNRIVYFLPEQGVLKRSSCVLQTELAIMENYFGRSIFESMVIIATESTSAYKYFPTGAKLFPPEDIAKTREFFQIAMQKVFKTNDIPNPPIVFISLLDTCEEVLRKIKESPVLREGVELEFNPSTCARCNIKIRILKEDGGGHDGGDYNDDDVIATCTYGDDWSTAIPYDESTCHPMMIPKYTTLQKFVGGIAHLMTLNLFSGKWPSFNNLDEMCINCGDCPKGRGCLRVKTEFTKASSTITVRHTSQVDESFVIKMESDCTTEADRGAEQRDDAGETAIVGGASLFSTTDSNAMGYHVNCAHHHRQSTRGQGDGGEMGKGN